VYVQIKIFLHCLQIAERILKCFDLWHTFLYLVEKLLQPVPLFHSWTEREVVG